jgi:membrane fusion protein (multidrug efflux system)
VGVVTVTPQPRTIVRELPGRIAPTRVADVRPRVSGIVIERHVQPGQRREGGRRALPDRSQTVRGRAAGERRRRWRRPRRGSISRSRRRPVSAALVKTQAISDRPARNCGGDGRAGSKAEVAAPRSRRGTRPLNLDYATIRAPISGRIGAARVSEGALVVQNDATNLATIQQLDPIYADFTQSASEFSKLRRALESPASWSASSPMR